MASILNSKARCYRYKSDGNEEADHCIESEADYFIKNLSQKQLETNVTLEQYVSSSFLISFMFSVSNMLCFCSCCH